MTTLLLPAEEVAKIRAMKGLAYVLAVMIRLDREYPGRAFRPEDVALIAGMDARTVAGQLKNLAVLDRVILSGSGYVLTQGGRALFLEPINNEALDQAPDSQVLALKPSTIVFENTMKTVLLPVNSLSPTDPDNTHAVCALEEVEEDSLNLKNQDSSSTSVVKSDGDTKIVREAEQISTAQILGATPVLFGDPGVVTARLILSAIDPRHALGWVAQAYDQRKSLRRPAGLVHSRLADPALPQPQPKYLTEPEKFLPNKYLSVLGLANADEKAESPDDLEIEQAEPVTEPEIQNDADHIWKRVIEHLKLEMPRSAFDAYVRDTQAISCQDGTLTIRAGSDYARDWLESRLASTVARMLVGILCTDMTVQFVVDEE